MSTEELKKKYLAIYEGYKNKGIKNKILMLFMSIPATLYFFYVIDGNYKRYNRETNMAHSQIIMITLGVGLLMIIIILSIKSISFLNSRKVRSFKYYFKKELFDHIKKEIPEIKGYVFNQKIHPKIFYNSNLFKSKYSDYVGDDWIRGGFDETVFEICELHVFNLFKNIFCGVFAWVRINTIRINIVDNLALNEYILDFEVKYDAKVLLSIGKDEFFIAIKTVGKFFEGENPKRIKSIDDSVLILKDIVELIKKITAANK